MAPPTKRIDSSDCRAICDVIGGRLRLVLDREELAGADVRLAQDLSGGPLLGG